MNVALKINALGLIRSKGNLAEVLMHEHLYD